MEPIFKKGLWVGVGPIVHQADDGDSRAGEVKKHSQRNINVLSGWPQLLCWDKYKTTAKIISRIRI
jgi:hypothetical protein